jgi:ubiquinone/menaquinone biosynthesis C-methylase UbiE
MNKKCLETCEKLKVSPDYFLFNLYNGYFCDRKKLDPFRDYLNIIKKLLPANTKILEIGGGAGIVGQFLKECLSEFGINSQLTIVDIDKTSLKYNIDPLTKKIISDNKSLPFADNSFDIVCARSATHYEKSKEDINIVLKEVSRVLKSKGFYLDQSITFEDKLERELFKNVHKILGRTMTLMGSLEYSRLLNKFLNITPFDRKIDGCFQKQSDLKKRYPLYKDITQQIKDLIATNFNKNISHFHLDSNGFGWEVPFTLFVGTNKKIYGK